MITGKRGVVAGKFENDDATARLALHDLALAPTHKIARAELAERRLVGSEIWLVGFRVRYIDLDEPIAFFVCGRGRRMRRRLRAVVAFDDDEIAHRVRQPQRPRALIFRRAVAGERGRIVRKLTQHATGAGA